MFVDFESLKDDSRVWIYQADREFSTNEVEKISEKIKNFVATWQRHGEDLKASFQIKYSQFIVLAVDESFNNVSGCSIDASVNLIKQLENTLNMDLTNKLNISFRDGNNINVVNLADFQKYAKEQKITVDTVVFNNMVATKSEFKNNWEVTANNSWHQRFLVN